MAKKETKYYNVVVVCNDRLTALNIANNGFKAGFAGSVRRESDLSVGPLDTYKVDVYGRRDTDVIDRFRGYVRGIVAGVCSINENNDD